MVRIHATLDFRTRSRLHVSKTADLAWLGLLAAAVCSDHGKVIGAALTQEYPSHTPYQTGCSCLNTEGLHATGLLCFALI